MNAIRKSGTHAIRPEEFPVVVIASLSRVIPTENSPKLLTRDLGAWTMLESFRPEDGPVFGDDGHHAANESV
jgi:hypothetical protein